MFRSIIVLSVILLFIVNPITASICNSLISVVKEKTAEMMYDTQVKAFKFI